MMRTIDQGLPMKQDVDCSDFMVSLINLRYSATLLIHVDGVFVFRKANIHENIFIM